MIRGFGGVAKIIEPAIAFDPNKSSIGSPVRLDRDFFHSLARRHNTVWE